MANHEITAKVAAEVGTLTRIINRDWSLDTVLLMLDAFPKFTNLEEAFIDIDVQLNALLAGLLNLDNSDRYDEVLAIVLYEIYTMDSLGETPSPELSQRFAKSYFFFLEFMIDFPKTIIHTVKFIHRMTSLTKNVEVGRVFGQTIARYTQVESFKKLGVRVLDNIDETHADKQLSTLKDIVASFIAIVTAVVNDSVDQVSINFTSLVGTPVAKMDESVYGQCITSDKNETQKRCNGLTACLIDAMQLMQSRAIDVAKQTIALSDLVQRMIDERLTTFESYSDCNVLRVVLDCFQKTKDKQTYYSWLSRNVVFNGMMENLLLSKDSEDVKYSFHFMQCVVALIKDKDEKKIWGECVNLLSTLDSFGKYLIEPQWVGCVGPLFERLSNQGDLKCENMSLFWMFNILANKAMKHENPNVVKCIMMHILDSNISFDIFHSLIINSVLPNLNNGKLYEDVAGTTDLHPKLAISIKDFFSKASESYPESMSKHFELIARRVHEIDAYNGRTCAWHIFRGLNSACIKSSVDEDLLNQIAVKAIQTTYSFPPYRRSIFIEDYICFVSCLSLSVSSWPIISQPLAQDFVQDILFHITCKDVRKMILNLISRQDIAEGICTSIDAFMSEIVQRCTVVDPTNEMYFWSIKLIDSADESFVTPVADRVRANMPCAIAEYMDEIERLNNNPYADFIVYNTLAILNMRRLLQSQAKSKAISSRISTIITAFINLCEQNYGYREEIEESLYTLLTQHSDLTDAWTKETLLKLLNTSLTKLATFMNTPFERTDDVADQHRTYKADILLIISLNIISAMISNQACEPSIIEPIKVVIDSMTKSAVRCQPLLKSTLNLYFDYLTSSMTDEKVMEYMNDGDHINIVTKYSRHAVNAIFRQSMLSKIKPGDDRVCRFYRHACDSIAKNRNTMLSYYVFESVMIVALEDVDDETAAYLCDRLIDVCEIEYAAFRLRRTAVMAIRLMLKSPAKINSVRKLVKYLVVKDETRPRDTSIMIDLRDYIHEIGTFDELTQERATADSYHAFPRLLTNCCIDRLFCRLPTMNEKELEAFDIFVNDIYEDFLYGHFTKENENKHIKPFEEKHRILVRKMHTLVILSKYVRIGNRY